MSNHSPRRPEGSLALLLLLGTLIVLTPGCAGYRLGATNPEMTAGRSIHVDFFQNRTSEPGLVAQVDQTLRHQIQQDGSLALGSQADASIILTGTLVRYEREAVTFRDTDVVTPLDFEVRLIAHVVATDRLTGRKLLDRDVSGRTYIRSSPDLGASERQAVPLLANDLARRITALLVEGPWWK